MAETVCVSLSHTTAIEKYAGYAKRYATKP